MRCAPCARPIRAVIAMLGRSGPTRSQQGMRNPQSLLLYPPSPDLLWRPLARHTALRSDASSRTYFSPGVRQIRLPRSYVYKHSIRVRFVVGSSPVPQCHADRRPPRRRAASQVLLAALCPPHRIQARLLARLYHPWVRSFVLSHCIGSGSALAYHASSESKLHSSIIHVLDALIISGLSVGTLTLSCSCEDR